MCLEQRGQKYHDIWTIMNYASSIRNNNDSDYTLIQNYFYTDSETKFYAIKRKAFFWREVTTKGNFSRTHVRPYDSFSEALLTSNTVVALALKAFLRIFLRPSPASRGPRMKACRVGPSMPSR